MHGAGTVCNSTFTPTYLTSRTGVSLGPILDDGEAKRRPSGPWGRHWSVTGAQRGLFGSFGMGFNELQCILTILASSCGEHDGPSDLPREELLEDMMSWVPRYSLRVLGAVLRTICSHFRPKPTGVWLLSSETTNSKSKQCQICQ